MAQIVFNHVGANHHSLMAHAMIIGRERWGCILVQSMIKYGMWLRVTMLSLIPTISPTKTRPTNKQCNTKALNTIYNAIDSKVFEQIKDCERANEMWKRLEETYEGTPVVKSAKLYILKDKLTSLKMKEDESILEMFHRLQVIVNDLKALREKIKDDDVSHRFLMCLPPRFEMLRCSS